MSRYEDRFGTDWDDLDREEAMKRAFVLGVGASLGERNEAEFEAILGEMETNYDQSIVELAYQEGKNKTAEQKRSSDPSTDEDDVWQAVINAELSELAPTEDDEAHRATDLPSSVSERTDATEKPDPDPEQTEFPDFLE
jgi:hypothetical protein